MRGKVRRIDSQSADPPARVDLGSTTGNSVMEGVPFSIINELASIRRLMTVDEVANMLGKSKFTIYRLAQRKQIPSVVIGGSRMFDPATLSMWLTKREPQLAVAARQQLKVA